MLNRTRIYTITRAQNNALFCHTAALAWWAYSPAGFTDQTFSNAAGFDSVERVVIDANLGLEFICVHDDRGAIIGIAGTQAIAPWLDYAVRTGLVDCTGVGGQVFRPFQEYAALMYDAVKQRLDSSWPVVLSGHSLGGALASIIGERLKQEGWNIRSVHTFGCPRIGDDAFVLASQVRQHHYLGANDVIPSMPPASHVSGRVIDPLGVMFPNCFRPPNEWTEERQSLASITPYGPFTSWTAAYSAFQIGAWQASRHSISTYLTKRWRLLDDDYRVQMLDLENAILMHWGIDVMQS